MQCVFGFMPALCHSDLYWLGAKTFFFSPDNINCALRTVEQGLKRKAFKFLVLVQVSVILEVYSFCCCVCVSGVF